LIKIIVIQWTRVCSNKNYILTATENSRYLIYDWSEKRFCFNYKKITQNANDISVQLPTLGVFISENWNSSNTFPLLIAEQTSLYIAYIGNCIICVYYSLYIGKRRRRRRIFNNLAQNFILRFDRYILLIIDTL